MPAQPGTFKDWVVRALQTLHSGLIIINARFDPLMATVEELQASLDANTAATNAAHDAIMHQLDQHQELLDQLSTSQPPTQAQLDQLNASTAKLHAATEALAADDTAPPTP